MGGGSLPALQKDPGEEARENGWTQDCWRSLQSLQKRLQQGGIRRGAVAGGSLPTLQKDPGEEARENGWTQDCTCQAQARENGWTQDCWRSLQSLCKRLQQGGIR